MPTEKSLLKKVLAKQSGNILTVLAVFALLGFRAEIVAWYSSFVPKETPKAVEKKSASNQYWLAGHVRAMIGAVFGGFMDALNTAVFPGDLEARAGGTKGPKTTDVLSEEEGEDAALRARKVFLNKGRDGRPASQAEKMIEAQAAVDAELKGKKNLPLNPVPTPEPTPTPQPDPTPPRRMRISNAYEDGPRLPTRPGPFRLELKAEPTPTPKPTPLSVKSS